MSAIIRPVITEKTLGLVQKENQYTFFVANNTNKIEVAKEVERIYSVSVENVRILNVLGKTVTFGKARTTGKKSDSKKAIVTLKKGNSISDFDIK